MKITTLTHALELMRDASFLEMMKEIGYENHSSVELWTVAWSTARYELNGRMLQDEINYIDNQMLQNAY